VVEERYDLGRLVTFIPNKSLPRHRWFFFKEGFSRDFVGLMLSRFGAGRGDTVLDPFVGVGTTCLTCRELGLDSVGVDVSPLFTMVARVKVRDYYVDKLRGLRDGLREERFRRPGIEHVKGFLRQLFSRYALEDLIFLRELINAKIQDEEYREFFLLALMKAAEETSYIYRDGAVVKVRRDIPKPPSLRRMFFRIVKKMIKDVEDHPLKPCEAVIIQGDARRLDMIEDESIDYIITSPPYLNKIEYTKVYWPEYELFFPGGKEAPMRSYLGLNPRNIPKDPLPDVELPPVARAYFHDLNDALAEMYRVLRRGGRAAVVIGGGVFPDKVVEVDIPCAYLAELNGFEVDRIIAVNKRVATTRRVIKIGETRESIVLLSKG